MRGPNGRLPRPHTAGRRPALPGPRSERGPATPGQPVGHRRDGHGDHRQPPPRLRQVRCQLRCEPPPLRQHRRWSGTQPARASRLCRRRPTIRRGDRGRRVTTHRPRPGTRSSRSPWRTRRPKSTHGTSYEKVPAFDVAGQVASSRPSAGTAVQLPVRASTRATPSAQVHHDKAIRPCSIGCRMVWRDSGDCVPSR